MIWVFLPPVMLFIILSWAKDMDLGSFETTSDYYKKVPQDVWFNFNILLVFLIVVSLFALSVSQMALRGIKKHQRMYPNSLKRGWTSNLEKSQWEFITIMAIAVIVIWVSLVLIFV